MRGFSCAMAAEPLLDVWSESYESARAKFRDAAAAAGAELTQILVRRE